MGKLNVDSSFKKFFCEEEERGVVEKEDGKALSSGISFNNTRDLTI